MWDPHARRRGDGPHGRPGRDHLRLLREPGAARPADHPRQGPLLGPGHGGGERARDGRVACTSARRRRCRQIAPDSPFMANLAWGAIRTSGAMLSWIFSGMFLRYPNLKIALSEGEIGWMPVLPRAGRAGARQAALLGRCGARQFMDHATTDVDLDQLDIRDDVPRPHLRLLHRGPPRHRQPRRDRRGQRHVRDRLPALRLDLARLHRHRPPADRRTCPRTRSTSSCGATPSGCTGSRRPSRPSSRRR